MRTEPIMFRLGALEMLGEDISTHTIFLGTTGSGKTLAMRLLQQCAIPLVGTGLGYRALVYDSKQDAMPILSAIIPDRSRLKLMNPFDARGVAWDISKDVTRPTEAMEIAHTLMPDVADNNPFFKKRLDSAHGVLCVRLRYRNSTGRLLTSCVECSSRRRVKEFFVAMLKQDR